MLSVETLRSQKKKINEKEETEWFRTYRKVTRTNGRECRKTSRYSGRKSSRSLRCPAEIDYIQDKLIVLENGLSRNNLPIDGQKKKRRGIVDEMLIIKTIYRNVKMYV